MVASAADRAQLEALVANGRTPQKIAVRARIVLMLVNRIKPSQVARTLGLSRMRIRLWAQRYLALGVGGLLGDAARPPGRGPLSPESKDPRFVEKLRDIVGLYLNPPAKAVVLSVDEKSNIQALDRTRPVLALQPHLPEWQTHDYIRHGTTTLFTALRLLDSVVIGECHARHRSKEFIAFLKRLDRELRQARSPSHRRQLEHAQESAGSPLARSAPARAPALHADKQLVAQPRRALVRRDHADMPAPRHVREFAALLDAIREYLDHYNRSPKPFVWTNDADAILAKIARVSNR